MLVDSHCHLNFPDFKEDLDAVLQRARDGGVKRFLTVNTRLDETDRLQEIAETHADVFFSVGIHPHEAQQHADWDVPATIQRYATHAKAIAIGETGLDYYYEHAPRAEQIRSFETHLACAVQCALPVIIHTREADADTCLCLKNSPEVTGVFHCFTGDLELAKAGLDQGLYISFSGILTFKSAQYLQEVARYVPLDRILVETDAPYLAPVPHRGKRNEPAFTVHTAEFLAMLKDASLAEVARVTTQNFFQLFTKAQ